MKKENNLITPTGEKINRVSVANSNFNQQLTKIKGTLTSQIRRRDEEKEPYYYAFVKLKGHGVDLPVIFRVQNENNSLAKLKKGDSVELTGHYSNSPNNIRKSFTCSEYQLLDKKIKKECSGCGDKFAYSTSENFTYCKNCAINGNRYCQNKCAECGDGSGIIKFSNQPVRKCKTCSLTSSIKFSDNQSLRTSDFVR